MRGKHFPISMYPKRKTCTACGYKTDKMANNQGRKPVIIVKSVIRMSVKNVLKIFIPVIKYKHMLDVEEKND